MEATTYKNNYNKEHYKKLTINIKPEDNKRLEHLKIKAKVSNTDIFLKGLDTLEKTSNN